MEVDGDGSGECGENADKLWEFENDEYIVKYLSMFEVNKISC